LREPASFLDAASLAAIDLVVSQFEPPSSIRHLLLPPPGQYDPNGINLEALKALVSCSGAQQLPAQEFFTRYQGLWSLVGSEFASQDQLKQLLVQVAPSTLTFTHRFFCDHLSPAGYAVLPLVLGPLQGGREGLH
jgi:hypothetical protein